MESDPGAVTASGGGVVVLTGAGVSADSGVPTFRDRGGLWEGRRPEDVATPEAWAADPDLVWRFYQARRRALTTVEPNAAHLALAGFERLCRRAGRSFDLVTQNVDDLHQRAGSQPIAMHGALWRLRCEACGRVERDLESLGEGFVTCPDCGFERLRPDVVWFGEMPQHLDRIAAALATCTVFLSIGTSGAVYPAAGLLAEARSRGARTLVNSLDEPDNLHPDDEFWPGRASEVVPAMLDQLAEALGLSGR